MKAQLLVNVDAEVLIELRNKNINKSQLINNFLREYLEIKETSKDDIKIMKEQALKIEAELANKKQMIKSAEQARAKKLKDDGYKPFHLE